jgi:very-short-patch-repair endonuclease
VRGNPNECGVFFVVQREGPTQSADRLILEIAGRQHGAVARWQLLRAGITPEAITTRLRDGRLRRIHQGVYLVGAIAAPHAHDSAALLAYGPRAVLSHRTAASIWDLLPYPASAPVWITIPPERSANRPRIKAVRADVPQGDIRVREDLLVTSPPRTILDLAAHLPAADLEQLVAEAHFRRLARERELCDQLDRNPGKRGAPVLRAVLSLPGGPQRTRSRGERRVLRLLRQHGITGFEANARIHGFEVDFLWRNAHVVLELDGYDGHSGRAAFERDRLKWGKLTAAGVRVLPVTGRQVRDDPDGIVQRLLLTLAKRPG